MTRFTVLVGAPKARSALRTAAIHAADTLSAHVGLPGPTDTLDLAELGPALLSGPPVSDVADALATVSESEVLLVASPQAHGTYTGLLKIFMDHLPQLGLAHGIAVPMATLPDLRNGHGIEDDLRLVLSDLGAWVVEPGLLLGEGELAAPLGVINAWAEIAAPRLREALAVRV